MDVTARKVHWHNQDSEKERLEKISGTGKTLWNGPSERREEIEWTTTTRPSKAKAIIERE